MRKILFIGSLVFTITLFVGCAVKMGNEKIADETDESISTLLENGKTTKLDVIRKFGEATNIDFLPDDLEKWEYTHTEKEEKLVNYVPIVNWYFYGTNDTKKTLVILFENDVVKKYTFSTDESEVMRESEK